MRSRGRSGFLRAAPELTETRPLRRRLVDHGRLFHSSSAPPRGDENRRLRAGADRAAGRDRRRDAPDRYARGERRRPFAAETEAFAGEEINNWPADQIGLDNRCDPRSKIEDARLSLPEYGCECEGEPPDILSERSG